TGAGVICGLMDNGLDPNHINFKDEAGDLRVKRVWNITGNNSAVREYKTPEAIAGFSTDNSTSTHGTHVLGLMAGGYKGKLQQYFINDGGNQQNSSTRANRYYGVATDAELAVNCGTLDGNNILVAAENILTYSKEQGKPAVMNLSLGHNTGPHDGTTAADRYLAEVGKEIIVCISAGNEGEVPLSISKKFASSTDVLRTCVGSSSMVTGVVDIWSEDNSPVTVTFAAVDKTSGAVKYQYKLQKTITGANDLVYITGNYYTASGYIHDPAFNSAFGERGAVIFSRANVNQNNNRYNVTVSVQTQNGQDSNIVPALFVEGQSGKTVYLYTNYDYGFASNGISGYVAGNADMSINDMACGDNVLCVGAYLNREQWAAQGGPYTYRGTTQGDVAPFSSYGVVNGRNLPDISGPGMGIVSSYSNYYVEATGTSGLTATLKESKRSSYWAEMSGTSMSSPFVAGVMALWLQADPTLTIGEVKEILKATAKQDEFTAAAPHRFGYGKIDALAGIKHILGTGGVADVKVDGEVLVSEVSRGCFDVYAAGAQQVDAALYGLNGAQVAAVSAKGDTATLTTEGLASGVYVLRAQAGAQTVTRKVVVR
ncbi:MAG: S8 family peptidase, partial [Muribaculaceae bacterium]|nr:S8 family peptidase [Muribaculaceae bacterium]